jgi:hypothetical protein
MSLDHSPLRGRQRMRRSEASVYLKQEHDIDRASTTLAKDAVRGAGPEITYVNGRPFYTPDALDAFAKKIVNPPVKSTAGRRRALASGEAA